MSYLSDYLDFDKTIVKNLFIRSKYHFEILKNLKKYIVLKFSQLGEEYYEYSEGVFIHKSAIISKSANIVAPSIICEGAEIRQCAFIRGNVIVGKNCVVGNSTEIKNSIMFDGSKAPHYNYVGDTIMGSNAHLGAGTICSNLKNDNSNVAIYIDGKKTDTKMRKVGALIGNNVNVGCNSVLCPGTIIGKDTDIYPMSIVRGSVRDNVIYKNSDKIIARVRKNEIQ